MPKLLPTWRPEAQSYPELRKGKRGVVREQERWWCSMAPRGEGADHGKEMEVFKLVAALGTVTPSPCPYWGTRSGESQTVAQNCLRDI